MHEITRLKDILYFDRLHEIEEAKLHPRLIKDLHEKSEIFIELCADNNIQSIEQIEENTEQFCYLHELARRAFKIEFLRASDLNLLEELDAVRATMEVFNVENIFGYKESPSEPYDLLYDLTSLKDDLISCVDELENWLDINEAAEEEEDTFVKKTYEQRFEELMQGKEWSYK